MGNLEQPGKGIETKAQEVLALATQVPQEIRTDAVYVAVVGTEKLADAALREVNEHHNPLIASANKTHKLAIAARDKYAKPLELLKMKCQALRGAYDRKKRELAAKQEAEARALLQKRLEEQQLQAALDAENLGDKELAEEIINEKTLPALVSVGQLAPKVEGASVADYWKAHVADKKAYLAHVLQHFDVLENTVEIIMPSLNKQAQSLKKEIEIAPGIFAVRETRGRLTGR